MSPGPTRAILVVVAVGLRRWLRLLLMRRTVPLEIGLVLLLLFLD